MILNNWYGFSKQFNELFHFVLCTETRKRELDYEIIYHFYSNTPF